MIYPLIYSAFFGPSLCKRMLTSRATENYKNCGLMTSLLFSKMLTMILIISYLIINY